MAERKNRKKYSEIIRQLKMMEKRGYIKTHRPNNTGVGKTLEDLLGIRENNFAGPNGHQTELKSGRRESATALTLFSKAPMPKGINHDLRERFGRSVGDEKILYTTINAVAQNRIYGKPGFRLVVGRSKISIRHPRYGRLKTPYWDKKALQSAFDKKYAKNLLYVKADSKESGKNERFHYNEAWLMRGFDFARFVRLLRDGHVKVDMRMGLDPDGRIHDHGTAFRIPQNKFELFFLNRKRVM